MNQEASKSYWNIFARELETVLAAHQHQMEDLSNLAGVSAEKTRYLIRSLHTPEMLPVLNREETKLLEQRLKLNTLENLQLRAGLLANFIQRTFVERVDQNDAFLLAEQTFPAILHALQTQEQRTLREQTAPGAVRWGAGEPIDDDDFEMLFESVLRTLNDAEMELQLSYNVNVHSTRVAKALAARTYFERAIVELEKADDVLQQAQLWKDNYVTGQRGVQKAKDRLEDLGAM